MISEQDSGFEECPLTSNAVKVENQKIISNDFYLTKRTTVKPKKHLRSGVSITIVVTKEIGIKYSFIYTVSCTFCLCSNQQRIFELF